MIKNEICTFSSTSDDVSDKVRCWDLILLKYFPSDYIKKCVMSIRDVYRHRYILKEMASCEDAFNFILDILIDSVSSKARFKTLQSLNVIKGIKKRFPEKFRFQPHTVDKLFFLFETFIFHSNPLVQESVNIYLKNQELKDVQIEWLILNFQRSEHVVNRLLRYPTNHRLIALWGSRVISINALPGRTSELISFLIEEGDHSVYSQVSDQNIIWGVYYAKISDERKKALLRAMFAESLFADLLKVCERLMFIDICVELIEFMKKKELDYRDTNREPSV